LNPTSPRCDLGLVVALAGLLCAGCVRSLPSSYACSSDSQCVMHGTAGVCERTVTPASCSFPVDTSVCPSGKRYGALDAPVFAGLCVPVGVTNGDDDLGIGGDGSTVTDGGNDLAPFHGPGTISRPGAGSLPPANNGSTVTLMKPTQCVLNDLLVVSVFANDDTVTVSAPAGWTVLGDLSGGLSGASSVFRATWLYHFAGASEPTSYTFTLSGSPSLSAGGIVDYRGVANPPIDASIKELFEPASFEAPSITTTQVNDYLVAMFVNGSSMSGVTWTAPAGMNSAVNNSVIGMFDQNMPTAGATGTKQATAGVNVPGLGAVDFIALKAAPL
jgi:hypothetical protein